MTTYRVTQIQSIERKPRTPFERNYVRTYKTAGFPDSQVRHLIVGNRDEVQGFLDTYELPKQATLSISVKLEGSKTFQPHFKSERHREAVKQINYINI